MAKIIESAPQRMVLQSGSTTLTLDKAAGKAMMQRKLWFWKLKPPEMPLAEVSEIAIDVGVDRASGIEVCNTMLVMRAGAPGRCPPPIRRTPSNGGRAAAVSRSALGYFFSIEIPRSADIDLHARRTFLAS